MKINIVLAVFVSLLFILAACVNDAQEVTYDGNFKIEFLFEHDSCKVYRFKDGGRYIYFSDCRGKINYSQYHSNGKHGGYTEHMETLNN